MPGKQVWDEIMTIFITGYETTANTLTWTFYPYNAMGWAVNISVNH
jgi:hypothetical protein